MKKKIEIKKLINIRVTLKEKKLLNDLAKVHTRGNLSAFLVHAGTNYKRGRND